MKPIKWRSRWSTWKYKHSYYNIPGYHEKYEDMRAWCHENFGLNWQMYRRIWRFRYKRDYQTFLLRWT